MACPCCQQRRRARAASPCRAYADACDSACPSPDGPLTNEAVMEALRRAAFGEMEVMIVAKDDLEGLLCP
jgi:hypothetical protein